ncbi:unnamed protein product, partial [Meganyctiphanes norvegica]
MPLPSGQGSLAWLACIFAMLHLAHANCPSACSCKWKNGKETVECRQKGLRTIPDGIHHGAQVLDLSNNDIKVMPSNIFVDQQIINLQKIFLSNCNLKNVEPDAFSELRNLVELDLSENQLRRVPGLAFSHTPELRELDLHGNPLEHIQQIAFHHLTSLKKLDISYCRLTAIDARAFEKLSFLEELKLNNNFLKEIRPKLVLSLQNLHDVEVHANPWTCDCRLRPLLQWLNDQKVPHPVSPVCAEPPRIHGRSFSTLDQDDFACQPGILRTNREIMLFEGENATIWCPVSGLPTPGVTWFIGDTNILNGTIIGQSPGKVYILNEASEERGSLLNVTGLTSKDSGLRIRCEARNAAGVASATFHVEVSYSPNGLGLPPEHMAVLSLVLVTVAIILLCVLFVVARRRHRQNHTRTLIPTKYDVNGIGEGRMTDIPPYDTSNYLGGSVVAATENPDLLCETRIDSDHDNIDGHIRDDNGSRASIGSIGIHANGHTPSLTRSLEDDGHKSVLSCPFDTMWAPERAHAVLDSAAPEHVMQTSLHEQLTPGCEALVQQRLHSTSQRQLNHRYSYLPDFAPDYSELFSFSQLEHGQCNYTASNTGSAVSHYGTIPRSSKARSATPVGAVPGDGTPTLIRHSRAFHHSAEDAPHIARRPCPPMMPSVPSSATSPPVQPPLHSHSSKLSRITARDSPDEGYQEGADV